MEKPILPPGNSDDLPGENQITTEFIKVAKIGTALGFGFMIASIQALGQTPDSSLVFTVSIWTFIAFAGGAALGFLFWRLALKGIIEKRSFKKSGLLVAIVGLVAFLYPLKFVHPKNRLETALGLLLAFGVLSMVGFVFLKIKNYLDRDYDSCHDS